MKSARFGLFALLIATLALAQSNGAPVVEPSNGRYSAQEPARTVALSARDQAQRRQSGAAQPELRSGRLLRSHKSGRLPQGNTAGLVSATQIPVGLPCNGYPNCASSQSPFPPVVGSFTSTPNVATVVKTHHPVGWAISVELSNPNGTFSPALTNVTDTTNEYDPLFVGSLLGDGVDDLVLIHYVSGSYEVFLNARDGSGSFYSQGVIAVTSNMIVGGTLAVDPNSGNLDLLLVDGASPANVYTFLGNGDGTFQAPTTAPLNIQLNANYPFTTVVFANLANHTNGKLDIAANAANNNQVNVFVANSSGYNKAVPLSSPDGTYFSCFNTAGDLSTTNGPPDLVSANCRRNAITIYVNGGEGSFAQGVYYPVDGDPVGVTIADVNQDGKNDIVSVNGQSADIATLLGNGNGTVQAEGPGFVTGGAPQVPAVLVDLNGDGNLDALVLDDEYSYAFLQGNGNGTFVSGTNYYAINGNGFAEGYTIASGDFNGDGIPDFVIGNSNSNTDAGITVFLSNSNGTLQPGVNYYGAPSANLEYVAVGDFNNNGNLDIAATDSVNGGVQIFIGNGKGTFTAGPTFKTDQVSTSTYGIVAQDLNGDGLPDIAVVNNPTQVTADVGVLLNTSKSGSFSFASPTNYPLSMVATEITAGTLESGLTLAVPLYGTNSNPGTAVATFLDNGNGTFGSEVDVSLVNGNLTFHNPYSAVIGDLNGDGIPDMAVTIDDETNQSNQGLALVLGNANGTFQAPTFLPTTLQDPSTGYPFPAYVKIGDINGDGIPDLAYTNSNFGTVGVLFGQGGGNFQNPTEYPAGGSAFGLALVPNSTGEINVAASGNSNDFSGVTLLLNDSSGIYPAASFSPTSLNFGDQGVWIPSNPLSTTLTNTGTVPLTISSIQLTGLPGDQSYTQTNNCPASLQPTHSCQITVIFTPTSTGTLNAAITVTDNAPGSPQNVPITGVGEPGQVTFSPTSLTFATQVVHTLSPKQAVQLTNTGVGQLRIGSIGVKGAFIQSNNCPFFLNPNNSCTFEVQFRPTGEGVENGALTLHDGAPGSPQSVPLTGTGTFVELTPTKVNFGNEKVGKQSTPRKITMANKGNAVVNITSITITGADPTDFSQTNNCPAQLAAGTNCTITVHFKPLTTGELTADVSVADDGGGSPQTATLIGTGITGTSPDGR